MRRILAVLAASALPCTLALSPAFAQPTARDIADACPPGEIPGAPFRDVTMYGDAIDCVYWYRISNGTSATTYEPLNPVTRGQMAAFVARTLIAAHAELPEGGDAFDDDENSNFENDINVLAAAGIVHGTSEDTFHPRWMVTRAQMAAFLVRAYDFLAAQHGQEPLSAQEDFFPDDGGSALEMEINKAAAAGMTGGHADGTYRAWDAVRRDHMALFLSRWLDLAVENGLAPGGPPVNWPPEDTAGAWLPLPDEMYPVFETAACDSIVTLSPGDVREVEYRATEQDDGSLRIDYRGGTTVDISRESDGAMIDELDASGPGYELISEDGLTVTFSWDGPSVIAAFDEVEAEVFVQEGFSPVFYYASGNTTEVVAFPDDPEATTIVSAAFTNNTAEGVRDVCDMLDEAMAP